jgi:hypothetical protein
VVFFVPPVPVLFVGALVFAASADELAAGAVSAGAVVAVGGAVSSGGGVFAATGADAAGVSAGGGLPDAIMNTPIIAPTATTAPMPMNNGVRFF